MPGAVRPVIAEIVDHETGGPDPPFGAERGDAVLVEPGGDGGKHHAAVSAPTVVLPGPSPATRYRAARRLPEWAGGAPRTFPGRSAPRKKRHGIGNRIEGLHAPSPGPRGGGRLAAQTCACGLEVERYRAEMAVVGGEGEKRSSLIPAWLSSRRDAKCAPWRRSSSTRPPASRSSADPRAVDREVNRLEAADRIVGQHARASASERMRTSPPSPSWPASQKANKIATSDRQVLDQLRVHARALGQHIEHRSNRGEIVTRAGRCRGEAGGVRAARSLGQRPQQGRACPSGRRSAPGPLPLPARRALRQPAAG